MFHSRKDRRAVASEKPSYSRCRRDTSGNDRHNSYDDNYSYDNYYDRPYIDDTRDRNSPVVRGHAAHREREDMYRYHKNEYKNSSHPAINTGGIRSLRDEHQSSSEWRRRRQFVELKDRSYPASVMPEVRGRSSQTSDHVKSKRKAEAMEKSFVKSSSDCEEQYDRHREESDSVWQSSKKQCTENSYSAIGRPRYDTHTSNTPFRRTWHDTEASNTAFAGTGYNTQTSNTAVDDNSYNTQTSNTSFGRPRYNTQTSNTAFGRTGHNTQTSNTTSGDINYHTQTINTDFSRTRQYTQASNTAFDDIRYDTHTLNTGFGITRYNTEHSTEIFNNIRSSSQTTLSSFGNRHDNRTTDPSFDNTNDNRTTDPSFGNRHDNRTTDPSFDNRNDNRTTDPSFGNRHDNRTTDPSFGNRHDNQTTDPSFGNRHDNQTTDPSFGNRNDNRTTDPSFGNRHDNRTTGPSFGNRHDNRTTDPSFGNRHDNQTTDPSFGNRNDNQTTDPSFGNRHDNRTTHSSFGNSTLDNQSPNKTFVNLRCVPRISNNGAANTRTAVRVSDNNRPQFQANAVLRFSCDNQNKLTKTECLAASQSEKNPVLQKMRKLAYEVLNIRQRYSGPVKKFQLAGNAVQVKIDIDIQHSPNRRPELFLCNIFIEGVKVGFGKGRRMKKARLSACKAALNAIMMPGIEIVQEKSVEVLVEATSGMRGGHNQKYAGSFVKASTDQEPSSMNVSDDDDDCTEESTSVQKNNIKPEAQTPKSTNLSLRCKRQSSSTAVLTKDECLTAFQTETNPALKKIRKLAYDVLNLKAVHNVSLTSAERIINLAASCIPLNVNIELKHYPDRRSDRFVCDFFVEGIKIASHTCNKRKQARRKASNAALKIIAMPDLEIVVEGSPNKIKSELMDKSNNNIESILESCSEPEAPSLGTEQDMENPTASLIKKEPQTQTSNPIPVKLVNMSSKMREQRARLSKQKCLVAFAYKKETNSVLKKIRKLAYEILNLKMPNKSAKNQIKAACKLFPIRIDYKTECISIKRGTQYCCRVLIEGIKVACGNGKYKRLAVSRACLDTVRVIMMPKLEIVVGRDNIKCLKGSDQDESLSQLTPLKTQACLQVTAPGESKHLSQLTSNPQKPIESQSYDAKTLENGILLSKETNINSANIKHRSSNVKLLDSFIILENENNSKKGATKILKLSVDFNNVILEYEFFSLSCAVRCVLKIEGEVFADVVSSNQSTAKVVASTQCLKSLKRRCWVLKTKQDVDSRCTMSKEDIYEVELKSDKIDTGNIGNRLLQKMGWSGGGIGKTGQGIVEPVSLTAVSRRQGLGFGRPAITRGNFQKRINEVIQTYAFSGRQEDLVFTCEFDIEERRFIHEVCWKLQLNNIYFGQRNEKCLCISRKRSGQQLFEYVKSCGGETVKYKLVPPGADIETDQGADDEKPVISADKVDMCVDKDTVETSVDKDDKADICVDKDDKTDICVDKDTVEASVDKDKVDICVDKDDKVDICVDKDTVETSVDKDDKADIFVGKDDKADICVDKDDKADICVGKDDKADICVEKDEADICVDKVDTVETCVDKVN